MRLLLTGATGFWGRHVLAALAGLPGKPPQIDLWLRHPDSWSQLPWHGDYPAVRRRIGALDASLLCRDAPAELDAVVHLAASVQHSRHAAASLFAVNVDGAVAAAELALSRGARLIVASTSGTVGCSPDPTARPDEAAPYCSAVVGGWPYYASKIAMEQRLRDLQARRGLRLVLLRPPVLLGPGDHRGRATGHVRRFLQRPLPFYLHGGMHFIDVRDAAQALVRVLQLSRPQAIYHLRGTAYTLREFFADLQAVSGRPAARHALPGALVGGLAQLDDRLGRWVRGRPFGLLPDPVVVQMARHFWDVASTHAEADLQYASRPRLQTLRDTVQDLLASS